METGDMRNTTPVWLRLVMIGVLCSLLLIMMACGNNPSEGQITPEPSTSIPTMTQDPSVETEETETIEETVLTDVLTEETDTESITSEETAGTETEALTTDTETEEASTTTELDENIATSTPSPTSTKTPTPIKQPVKKTPTPTAAKLSVGEPRATCTTAPNTDYKADVTYPSGTYGLTNEIADFRPAIGRRVEPFGKVAIRTKVEILSRHTSSYNELWYKVRLTWKGKSTVGYIQSSSIDMGTSWQPTPKSSGLVQVGAPAGALSKTYGKDKDGDGIYVVVLDPGHGSSYGGAHHYNTNEKDINLKVALYCKAYLESTYVNVKVYITRAGDYVFTNRDGNDDLEFRVQYAVDRQADLLVSMHFDSSQGGASGAEVLISKKPGIMVPSEVFGSYVLDEFKKIGRPVRGIYKRTSIRSKYADGSYMDSYLINRLAAERGMIGVIIEHCFMSSTKDRQFWDSDSDLQAYGQADARAIARFLKLYKPGEVTPTPKPTATSSPIKTPTPTKKPVPSSAPTLTPTTKPTATPFPSIEIDIPVTTECPETTVDVPTTEEIIPATEEITPTPEDISPIPGDNPPVSEEDNSDNTEGV